MSSAAALEALINELFITPEGELRAHMPDFENEFWKPKVGVESKSILEKYQYALLLLNKPKLNKYISPYQEAEGLIELRNMLVHFKPTWDPDRKRRIDLSKLLEGRFALSPFLGSGSDLFSMRCMSAGCMQWAVGTVKDFVREFGSQSQLDPNKLGAFTRVGA